MRIGDHQYPLPPYFKQQNETIYTGPTVKNLRAFHSLLRGGKGAPPTPALRAAAL